MVPSTRTDARWIGDDPSKAPTRSIGDWPIAGAGEGCNAFLTALGVEDALIAYSPAGRQERSLFVIGLRPLRERPEQLRRLLQAAERLWSPFVDRLVSVVDLPTGVEEPSAYDAGDDRLLVGSWPSPLDPFGQGIVAQQITSRGKIDLFLLRRRERDRFGPEARMVTEAALPLFADAVLGYCEVRRSDHSAALLRILFDRMSAATLLVNAQGRPLMTNTAACALLHRRDPLLITVDGTIAAQLPRESRALKAAICNASDAEPGENNPPEAVRLTNGRDGFLLVVVIPARAERQDGTEGAAMVIVHEPKDDGAPAYILSALGLLPSEQRFLDSFLRSKSLSEAADRSNLSHETARTYLKRIRSKMGAHRQMDLARMVYGLVPPIACHSLKGA